MDTLSNIAPLSTPTQRMPLLFVGHGSPMNAIEDNRYSRAWKELGARLPRPKAILSISAHWITRNTTEVTAMEKPKTIHDFGGFPDALFAAQYPAPGAPAFAAQTQWLVTTPPIGLDHAWGLDHGTWSVLLPMFPKADIPVFQLSLDYGKPMQWHYELGAQLKALRERGVLVMGSGNIVHNLRTIDFGGAPFDWAVEFDKKIGDWIAAGDHSSIVNFQKLGSLATMAHPTYDHFLPLIYTLGLQDKRDTIEFFNTGIDAGSISMRSFVAA